MRHLPQPAVTELASSRGPTPKLTHTFHLTACGSISPKVSTSRSPRRHTEPPYTFGIGLLYYLRHSILLEKIRSTTRKINKTKYRSNQLGKHKQNSLDVVIKKLVTYGDMLAWTEDGEHECAEHTKEWKTKRPEIFMTH